MPPTPVVVRPLSPADRGPLAALLREVDAFSAADVEVALELIDDALERPAPDGYFGLVARGGRADGPLLGYICYGPTPMTVATWDLYWIATAPGARRTGAGKALHAAFVRDLLERGGAHIRVETSSGPKYVEAVGFYRRLGYREASILDDFYRPGEHLHTFWGDVAALAAAAA